jgi:hypothetical protein
MASSRRRAHARSEFGLAESLETLPLEESDRTLVLEQRAEVTAR